jgi:hypothetical protein
MEESGGDEKKDTDADTHTHTPGEAEGGEAAATAPAENESGGGTLSCPEGMDPEAFACLPEDIQRELIREHEATQTHTAMVEESGLDPEALQALPEALRYVWVCVCV